jgi:cobalt-zinc-cadmium efflux system membrane fusion protein
MKRIGSMILATAFALSAHATEEPKAAHEEDPLVVDAATQKSLGIVTQTLAPETLADELRAPGEVKANAYATTLVSPRIPAQVLRRHAKLGDTVKAGQALVTLSSVEVAEAQGALIVAERDWARVKQLGAEAVSAKRYTESQVARDQALAKLRAYGVGEGEIAALAREGSRRANGEFALTAPQPGRVTTDDFIAGERVEPGKVLFTLVDESRVWVEAQLPPDAAERVESGAATRIVAHGKSLEGRVVQLSHRTTEASRTTPVRVEVGNESDGLHPGEFVEAFIATREKVSALSVPTEAIVQLQGQPSVFKLTTAGRFEATAVRSGATRGDRTLIGQGLNPGDVVVVEGAYALKARLLKSQLGEGHGD